MNVHHNMTTTQFELHGFEVVQTLGMVRGIICALPFDLWHHWRQFTDVGGWQYHFADQPLREDTPGSAGPDAAACGQLDANAVVGVRYDATAIMQGVTEVLAYGTAVMVKPKSS